MKVKEITVNERPREKAVRNGIDSLSNRELIAIILGIGSKKKSALEIADDMLNTYHTLAELSAVSLDELMQIDGIKQAKGIQLQASFELSRRVSMDEIRQTIVVDKPRILSDWLNQWIGFSQQEHFIVVFLDNKNAIIKHKVMFIGTMNSAVVHPREVYREAISIGSSKIICAHNHPSGDITPSQEDIHMTRRLKEVGDLMQIPLLDHIIVGKNNYLSFREKLLID